MKISLCKKQMLAIEMFRASLQRLSLHDRWVRMDISTFGSGELSSQNELEIVIHLHLGPQVMGYCRIANSDDSGEVLVQIGERSWTFVCDFDGEGRLVVRAR